MFILVVGGLIPVPLLGDNGDKNPVSRLADIRSKIVVAEQRVRDLESLLTALILEQDTEDFFKDKDGNPVDLGDFDPTDANAVRQQLYQARAYEGELRTAEQFWNQITESNKTAEKDTQDFAKRA